MVVIVLAIVKLVPVNAMPEVPFVLRLPLIVVVPEPEVWEIEPAVMARVEILLAWEKATAPSRVVPPAIP